MPNVREVFEMTTEQIEPDLGAWNEQERRQRRTTRNKKIGTFVVVAAIGLAAVAAILATRDPGRTTPANERPALNPTTTADPGAIAAATGFFKAFGAFDADRAIAYLADDADLSALDAGTVERLPLMLRLLEAQGYRQRLVSCGETSSGASGTLVGCTFDFDGIRSDEIGRGPYHGSSFDFTVRNGEIVRVSLNWEVDKFSPQMWEPFARWVSKEYRRDAAVMYNSDFTNFQLTKRSIRLWGEHSREYVDVVAQRTEG